MQNGISGASVHLYTSKDSLNSGTDKNENFSFGSVPKGQVELIVSSLGFQTYKQELEDRRSHKVYGLPAIILQSKSQLLTEVNIKVHSPIRMTIAKLQIIDDYGD
ncbi:hypothetical protein [Arcticibacter sp.]|uniref:hypothetical protein n=1 Tax=Arcticibacter sp. TaxID=1872630 RepID=UPI003890A24D